MRLVSWNLEWVVPYLEGPAPSLAEVARAFGSPDVFCIQELRLLEADVDRIARLRTALPGWSCGFSLCHDEKNVTFRGGRMYGVATFVKDALGPAAHAAPAWDREGRVLFTTFAREKIVLANVYAVNGTSKPYFDHALGRVSGDRHAYKRRWNRELAEEAARFAEAGYALVLVGDWNISRARIDTEPRLRTEGPHALARAEFNERFLPVLDVVDAFRELHPAVRKYTWFNRRAPKGKLDAARVDYALVSRSLLPRVTLADVDERPESRFASDHAPVVLEWV